MTTVSAHASMARQLIAEARKRLGDHNSAQLRKMLIDSADANIEKMTEEMAKHRCQPPAISGGTISFQPDWTCGQCGRTFRDMRTPSGVQWWAEVKGPGK